MVMMGSSLALSCGGATAEDLPKPSGTGGSGGTGGTGGSGGLLPGTGGIAGTGGLVGTGGRIEPQPCVPAQWDCSANPPACYGDGVALPEDCPCDASRPKSADDCGEGQSFICLDGMYTVDGESLPEAVPFECSCVPEQTYCGLACDAAFPAYGYDLSCRENPNGEGDILCGCAVIVLR
jgi:hypothetical protein